VVQKFELSIKVYFGVLLLSFCCFRMVRAQPQQSQLYKLTSQQVRVVIFLFFILVYDLGYLGVLQSTKREN
jgi:hypothetical protein